MLVWAAVAGSYVTGSIVMIDQMDMILKRNGIAEGINGTEFYATIDEAKQYCLAEIDRIKSHQD